MRRSAAKFGIIRDMKLHTAQILALLAIAGLAGCNPGDGTQQFADGERAYAARDLRKAEKLFARAAELDPANADAFLMLARARLDLGDLEGAKGAADSASVLAGGDCDIAATVAQIAYHIGDYDAAEKGFLRLAEDVALSPHIRSQAYTDLGIVQMTREERDAARVSFLAALKLDRRRNPAAYYHLGMLYRDAYSYAEAAQEQFELFVRLPDAPVDKVLKVQRDVLPAIREKILRATAQVPNAANRDSQASAAALEKAEAAAKKGNYKVALEQYKVALQKDPLSYPAAIGIARAYARDKAAASRKSAFDAYCTAAKLKPMHMQTLLDAARLAGEQRQWITAVELYSRAVAANPVKLDAIDGLIRALENVPGNAKTARLYLKYRKML